jgi:hypothetical protein
LHAGAGNRPTEAEVTERTALLLEAIGGDRYPAVRHLAAGSLARLLDGRAAAALARGIDATADEPTRDRALAALRAVLSGTHHPGVGELVPDQERLQRLRAEARRADIDIGE